MYFRQVPRKQKCKGPLYYYFSNHSKIRDELTREK